MATAARPGRRKRSWRDGGDQDGGIAAEARRMLRLSELLIEDRPTEVVLQTVVEAVTSVAGIDSAAVILADGDDLKVEASSGEAFSADELEALVLAKGRPVPVGLTGTDISRIRVLSLSVSGRPIGILALRGLPRSPVERDALTAFANHAAIAVERARLRAEAARAEVLERTNRLREALLTTVAHDLRGPLSSMKVATSCLADPGLSLPAESQYQFHRLLDSQVDHLTRLVSGLLDLARSQAGVLDVDLQVQPAARLLNDAVALSSQRLPERQVVVDAPDDLPAIEADPLLVKQVIANLLENADRCAPADTAITVSARHGPGALEVSVADRGPGVVPGEEEAVFDPFLRRGLPGRAGLGLAIAKTFVEAHRQRIWVEHGDPCGARFVFTLPLAVG